MSSLTPFGLWTDSLTMSIPFIESAKWLSLMNPFSSIRFYSSIISSAVFLSKINEKSTDIMMAPDIAQPIPIIYRLVGIILLNIATKSVWTIH